MEVRPLAAWAVDQRRRGLAETTIQYRRKVILMFQRWLGRPVLSAATEDAEGWLDSHALASASRASYLKSLASLFEFAVRTRLVKANPIAAVRRPKVPRGLPHPIPEADLQFALAQAPARIRAWLCLAAYAGLRCHEIAQLRREDLILDRARPLLLVQHGKGNKARAVPLNPLVEEAIRANGLPARGFLFQGTTGNHVSASTVSRGTNAFLKGLGISSTAHDGRHYFGTEIYRRSKDIRLTQALLGHSSLQTTQIYAAYDPEGAEVVRDLGRAVPLPRSASRPCGSPTTPR